MQYLIELYKLIFQYQTVTQMIICFCTETDIRLHEITIELKMIKKQSHLKCTKF